MKSTAAAVLACFVIIGLLVSVGTAQNSAVQEGDRSTDPRVGLKPGLRDAGVAARNMELVANVPKPRGFFDPRRPAGEPTGPERPEKDAEDDEEEAKKPERPSTEMNFANSDLAFHEHYLFAGNFAGFNIYDIANPKKPKLVSSVVCPGGQGDVSVHGTLLFMSVEQTRGRVDCGTQGVAATVSAERFRGIRIFDISDLSRPKQVAAVQTCRGSHTHTLLVDPDDKANVYIYGSGTGRVRSAQELAGCSGGKPEEDPDTALFSIDVIQVPLASPAQARVVNRPRIFADPKSGAIAGLWPGGRHGPGTQKTSVTNQCHDITVFPEIGLAAGACSGNGLLLDISDPVNPVRLDHVVDKNFAYWHSATFNNDGSKVIFTDEWGGGTRPRCRSTDLPTWGANAIFNIVERKLQFASYYKLPPPQTEQENCVAHNGSIVPVPGRDIMVQGWYQGGVSVFDFTDASKPVEIAFFDRGPLDAKMLITGGHWSAYWYNGLIYGTEIARGLDVFRLTPSDVLSENELAAAELVRMNEFNAQHQRRISWPRGCVVARAYLDQLTRAKAIDDDRARAVRVLLDRGNGSADDRRSVVAQLERDADAATGVTAERLRALAANISSGSEPQPPAH